MENVESSSKGFFMTKLNVCLVSPLPPPYGGISHWTSMVTKYASDRQDVAIAVVNTAPRWRSIHDTGVFMRSIGGGLQLIRDIGCLAGTLILRRSDIVHLTTSGHLACMRDLVVSYVAAIFCIPVVYHIRFGRIPALAVSESLEWRLIHWVMRRASVVVTIDQYTLRAVEHHAPGVNVVLIPNCVNSVEFSKPRDENRHGKTMLFVGWVVSTKGVGELIEAWAKVNPQDWKLEIVGPIDAIYREELLAQFRPERLEFVGELPHAQAMERMAKCDLFVFPSYTEGFPNVVVEAMVLGKAIVATDVGAIPEMLADGCGMLVKPRDVDGLVAALSLLIADEHQRAIMGERASSRAAAKFSLESVFATYMSVWQEVAGVSKEIRGTSL